VIPPDLRHGRFAEEVRRRRLIVVLRRITPQERLLELVDELADAGARIFEVTMDEESAADSLRASAERLGQRGDGAYMVGAGTVRTPKQLRAALDAKAAFAVAPTLNPALIGEALDAQLPFIPGAATPTEAELAWASGATFVKLFPASSLGPSFIRELQGPMPDIETIPTGGITVANAQSFLDAGAVAIGMGFAIVQADATQRRGFIASLADVRIPR
jgi:2-dehydro-3-deoxyphosphogluconate aldolase/(4S)-4-hydroxy-2-oxoglutarate aldolase